MMLGTWKKPTTGLERIVDKGNVPFKDIPMLPLSFPEPCLQQAAQASAARRARFLSDIWNLYLTRPPSSYCLKCIYSGFGRQYLTMLSHRCVEDI